MNEEILRKLKEIKELLQIIVSNQEQPIKNTLKLNIDGQTFGEISFKNDITKMPNFKGLTNLTVMEEKVTPQ